MADIKAIAEELVNLTVKEVNELATVLKDEIQNYSLPCPIKWQTSHLQTSVARKSIWQKKKCLALWLFAKSMENPNR